MVTKDDVLNALKKVADPHMGISIVDMGLIKNIEIDEENNVSFELIPTNPACMSVMGMAMSSKDVVKKIKGVKDVKVTVKGHMMEEDLNNMINK